MILTQLANQCEKMFLMRLLIILGLAYVVRSASLPISDDKNVNKREADGYIPDWAPFQTKSAGDLSDFVQLTKAKPKKRLAPPMNFQLKAVAESEDYFDGTQGDSDSDDYYEKKEWSDLNRPGDKEKHLINHTEISEIDGIVNSIIDRKPTSLTKLIKKQVLTDDTLSQESLEINDDKKKERLSKNLENNEQKESSEKIQSINNDEDEDEPSKTVNTEENKENEAKKAKILESVDELKHRHAQEQQLISEKAKEEEMLKEEVERQRLSLDESENKYSPSHRYKQSSRFSHDNYNDENTSIEDKYQILPRKVKTTTTVEPKVKLSKELKNRYDNNGRHSVFTDPRPYMEHESKESVEVFTTENPKRTRINTKRQEKTAKVSSKYKEASSNEDEQGRIYLVPESEKHGPGEPVKFFPRKRKNKGKKRTTSSRPKTSVSSTDTTQDATASGSTEEFTSRSKDVATSPSMTFTSAVGSTEYDSNSASTLSAATGPSESDLTAPSAPSSPFAPSSPSAPSSSSAQEDLSSPSASSTAESAPSAQETLPSNVNIVKDAAPASSDHKKEEKKPDNYHKEKGGGKEHHSEFEEEKGEHGKKAYEGLHKDSKSAKGHHDKEDHLGKYDDHGGHDHKHHKESGHYGEHHHEEHGKKHAKYEESGKHSKGHNTKGSHDIHKKEEYEKKVEFFEEEGDSAEEEKHGGYKHEKEHASGGHFKKGSHEQAHKQHANGESGHFGKGGFAKVQKGHDEAIGHDHHHKREHSSNEGGGKKGAKSWVFHHGSPAKTANFVIIDRRHDQPYYSPTYFG